MNKKNKKNNKENKNAKKEKVGIVVSDKMDKTIVVKIDRLKMHSKYKKRYKTSKKYKAHDEENRFKIGDRVAITESNPISKDKKWIAREAKSL